MRETIRAGTVFFKEGTPLPDGLTFDAEPYSRGWRSIKGLDGECSDGESLDGYAIGRKMPEAGWKYFYMAGESRATAFGREGQETIRRATKKILAGLKSEKSNSVEITGVVFKKFLGMPYASVSFHLRNLQESMLLVGCSGPGAWRNTTFVGA